VGEGGGVGHRGGGGGGDLAGGAYVPSADRPELTATAVRTIAFYRPDGGSRALPYPAIGLGLPARCVHSS